MSACLQRSNTSMNLKKITLDDQTYPVVILGGGVGGLTAALYCQQANIPCIVLEGPKPGGALGQSHSVRNWPSVEQAPGRTIVDGLAAQAAASGAVIRAEKAISVDFSVWPRVIETQAVNGAAVTRKIKALTVIIAMGTEPNYLGIPGEAGPDGYWGRGVSNCAVCEGSLYQNKDVVIIGGGDAAITEASYLAGIARQVTLLLRGDQFRAKDTRARDQVLALPNVTVRYTTTVQEIIGNGASVTGVVIQNSVTKATKKLATDGVFLAIGSRPNTGLFTDKLTLDNRQFITCYDHQETSVPGIYAVGDVCDNTFVQAVTAAGDGCKAALQAVKLVKSLGYEPAKVDVQANEAPVEKLETPAKQPQVTPAPKTTVQEIFTETDFTKSVMQANKPVVIDLFATWCIPCQQMSPIIDTLAEDYAGTIAFVKINITGKILPLDKILHQLGSKPVQSVPTFLFIENGKEIGRLVGATSAPQFEQALKNTFGLEE